MRRLRRAWWRWRLARLHAQVERLEVIIRASKETGYNPENLADRCAKKLQRASFRVQLVAHRLFELAPARQLEPADGEVGGFVMFQGRPPRVEEGDNGEIFVEVRP